MKKEAREKIEKVVVSIQVVSGGDEQDGRANNTFRDRRTDEIKLTRSLAVNMMDEMENVVEKYKKIVIEK